MPSNRLPKDWGVVALAALLVAGAVVATAFLPTAHAQVGTQFPTSTQIKITPAEKPIMPQAGVAVLQAEVGYSYFSGAPAREATQVTLEVAEHPPWATVQVSPSTLFFDMPLTAHGGTQASAVPQKVSLLVATTADAPAFTPANLRITATAHPNFPYGGSTSEDATLVTADYFSLLAVDAPEDDVRVGAEDVPVPLAVRNFGNGVTKVTVRVVDAPPGVEVDLPRPFALASRQTGGAPEDTTKAVTVDVRAPDGLRRADDLVLRVDAAYALDAQIKGASEEVVLHLEPDSGSAVSATAQSAGLGLLGGAVGLAAGVRQWRRGGT